MRLQLIIKFLKDSQGYYVSINIMEYSKSLVEKINMRKLNVQTFCLMI